MNQCLASLAGGTKKAIKTAELRQQYLAQPAQKRAIVEAVLAQPDVQANLVRAADLSGSGLSVSRRNQDFLGKVDTVEAGLADSIADPLERRRTAIGQVADAYAAEYPDYQLMQVLAAVQPPQQHRGHHDARQRPHHHHRAQQVGQQHVRGVQRVQGAGQSERLGQQIQLGIEPGKGPGQGKRPGDEQVVPAAGAHDAQVTGGSEGGDGHDRKPL